MSVSAIVGSLIIAIKADAAQFNSGMDGVQKKLRQSKKDMAGGGGGGEAWGFGGPNANKAAGSIMGMVSASAKAFAAFQIIKDGAAEAGKFIRECGQAADEANIKLGKLDPNKLTQFGRMEGGVKEIKAAIGDRWQSMIGGTPEMQALGDFANSTINQLSDHIALRTTAEGDARRRLLNPTANDKAYSERVKKAKEESERIAAANQAAIDGVTGSIEQQTAALEGGAHGAQMYILAKAGMAEQDRLAIRTQLEFVDGLKKRKDMEAEMSSLHERVFKQSRQAGMTADQKQLDDFRTRGADGGELAGIAASLRAGKGAGATDTIAELNRHLRESISTFGMSAEAAARWKAVQDGATPALIAQNSALEKQKKQLEENQKLWASMASQAANLITQSRTPFEEYRAKFEDLQKLLKNGLIDPTTAQRAEDANRRALFGALPDAVGGRPAALLKGSAAAFSASFGQTEKDGVTKEQLDQAKQSLVVQRDQLAALKRLEGGQVNVLQVPK